jgi:hypothetical protein
MQEQYLTTQIGILSEALKNLQASVNALSVSEPEEDLVIGGTTIDQTSELYSILNVQDNNGIKEPTATELKFQKTGNTSLLYIKDGANNNIPLRFAVFQDNVDNNNNSVSISVDNVSNAPITLKGNKVGINKLDPEEELEVDGSIQIDSANVARLKFQYSGENPHKLAEIDGEQDGIDGGDLQFYTKVDGDNLTEKLRINNVGAIGIGGASYGSPGQVLTSNGSGNPVSWSTPSGGGGGNVLLDEDFTTPGIMTTDGSGIYSTIINNSENWNAAHSWGDHSIQGYLTDVNIADVLLDEDFTTPGIMTTDGGGIYSTIINNSENWNAAHSWGNHADEGYLTDVNIADVLLDEDFTTPGIMTTDGSGIYSTIINNSENWNTAYSWGDHSIQGYLTDVSSQTLAQLQDVKLTNLTTNDLLKYDGTNFVNFSPTYLDGSGIADNFLIKIVNNQTETTLFKETVQGTSTLLESHVADGVLLQPAGSIKSEFDGIKSKMHLYSGISGTSGITVTSEGKVGINKLDPEEELEVDGSIQIDSANVARLKFQKSGENPHKLAEIDGEQDGIDGGDLQFYTKVDGDNLTEKLRINNVGAIGIGGASYGSPGQVLTSNGSNSSVSWTTPSGGGGGGNLINLSVQGVTNKKKQIPYTITKTITASDITARLDHAPSKEQIFTFGEFLENQWIAVGQGTNTIAYSRNGIDWTGLGASVFTTAGNAVVWSGSSWVAVGQGTNTLAQSADGVNWNGLGASIFSNAGNKVNTNGTLFVAVGSGTNSIAYATFYWTGIGTSIFTNGYDVCFNGERWVAVGDGANTIAYSADGINWTGLGNIIFTSGRAIAWNGNLFVAGGVGSNTLAWSYDGISWNTTPPNNTLFGVVVRSLAWNGEKFLAFGAGTHTIGYSTNGIDWTGLGTSVFANNGRGATWNGAYWVAVGDQNNTLAWSRDGISWIPLGTSIFSGYGYGIAYNYRRPNTITFPANNKTGTVNIPSGSITLNSTTLDVVSDSYNNFGYTNFAMSIS